METKILRGIIDELGALDEELAPLKPKIKRAESLRKLVSGVWQGPATEGAKIEGDRYVALVSARDNQRFLTSIRKVAKAMGAKFWQHCAITLKAVEEHLDPEIAQALIGEAFTGPRHVTTYRAAPKEKTAA